MPNPVGKRVVTQNLIVSAANLEYADHPQWSSIQDLTTFIDLYCLYDSVVVLGREINSALGHSSGLGDLVRDSGFVTVETPTPNELDLVTNAAKRHLLTYLGEKELGDFDSLLRDALTPDRAFYGLTSVPDGAQDWMQGDEWLRTTPRNSDFVTQLKREANVARGTTFLMRSFLYVAYADVTGLPFVCDSARAPAIRSLVGVEMDLRDRLLKTITSAAEQRKIASALDKSVAAKPIAEPSPLAAVALERCNTREELARVLTDLRAELAPVRNRLRLAEEKLLFGKGDEVADAQADWKLIFEELARSYGLEPHLISWNQILNYGKDAGGLIDEPHKSKAWITFLLGLPFDVLRRIVTRQPVIELHALRYELPAPRRLTENIERLFGEPTL